MINQAKLNMYAAEMFRTSFSAAHFFGTLFFGGYYTKEQLRETMDFFCANDKRKIETNLWITDAEKENKKRNCDAFYSSLKSQLGCKL